MAKEGSTVGGLMDCFGTAISMSLQYGVPLEVLVNKFSHTRFEPMGHTNNPDIRIAKSLVDYIFRWLGITFLAGYREANQAIDQLAPPSAPNPADSIPDSTVSQTGAPKLSSPLPVNPGANGLRANGASSSGNSNGSSVGNVAGVKLLKRPMMSMNADPLVDLSASNQQFARFQVDAPPCDVCGNITVRNGNCYLCYNCGNSMGCS